MKTELGTLVTIQKGELKVSELREGYSLKKIGTSIKV